MPNYSSCFSRRTAGYTLLEMGIVLAVIGLITGAVLGGAELVRESQIRTIVAEKDRYEAAMKTFQTKYGELPGDFSRADKIWGVRHATTDTCIVSGTVSGNLTCNGDGNGHIHEYTNSNIYTNRGEGPVLWHHLSLAGLINYPLSGYFTVTDCDGSKNCPQPAFASGSKNYFDIEWSNGNMLVGGSYFFTRAYPTHILTYGQYYAGAATNRTLPFTTTEAMNLDKKIDDGMPATGVLYVSRPGSGMDPQCVASGSTTTYGVYDTAVSIRTCGMIFQLSF